MCEVCLKNLLLKNGKCKGLIYVFIIKQYKSELLMWAWAWNMWPWGIQLMLCYKKCTIYIWHIFQSIRNAVRISIRKIVLMALKIEVQTLTINFCSWVDPLWICMKTKYPKSHKIQSWITLFAFMSPFHLNIVILNNVLLIAKVGVLIMVMFIYVSQI